MNQIHYYVAENRFVAVAPNQFSETITFCQYSDDRYPLFASISLQTGGGMLSVGFYEQIESGYRPSTYKEYTAARRKAQVATVEFFGEYQQFQAPPVEVDSSLLHGFAAVAAKRPTHIDRPNAHHLVNDLPF